MRWPNQTLVASEIRRRDLLDCLAGHAWGQPAHSDAESSVSGTENTTKITRRPRVGPGLGPHQIITFFCLGSVAMRRSSRGTQLEEHPAATATQQRQRHLRMQAARSRSTPGATVARPSFREHIDYLAQATQRPASRLGHQYPRNKYRECWPKSLC